jgi:hypothetical protein
MVLYNLKYQRRAKCFYSSRGVNIPCPDTPVTSFIRWGAGPERRKHSPPTTAICIPRIHALTLAIELRTVFSTTHAFEARRSSGSEQMPRGGCKYYVCLAVILVYISLVNRSILYCPRIIALVNDESLLYATSCQIFFVLITQW